MTAQTEYKAVPEMLAADADKPVPECKTTGKDHLWEYRAECLWHICRDCGLHVTDKFLAAHVETPIFQRELSRMQWTNLALDLLGALAPQYKRFNKDTGRVE